MDIGRLLKTEISQEMKKAYLDYAMSVIVARALPDVRDGLKPVHRRILYALHEMGLAHTAKYAKSAKIVGEVMGKYHPHGDMPIYDALVRLAQDFSMRYPLVDGQGNFGSLDGDPPAAMRYCVTGNTLIVTQKGLLPIKDISLSKSETIRLTILSRNRKTNVAVKWFNSGEHPTIKIETKQGFTLQGSWNHPILTWVKDDGTNQPKFNWKLLSQMKVGDIAVIDRTHDLLWPEREIPLDVYVPQQLYYRTHKKKLPKTFNKELAFILGGLTAEGTMERHEIEFCNSDTVWITALERSWKRVFPNCRIHKFQRKPNSYGKKTYQTLEIHSQYVLAFLRNIGLLPEKSKERTIPNLIFQSPKEVVATFLQAYFEGDGGITTSGRMIELSCVSKSPQLISQLQILLLRFGILATKRFDRYRSMYKLYIRGLKNYQIFQEEIGFFSRRKNEKLRQVIKKLQKNQSLFDYVPFLRDYVYANIDSSLPYENVRGFIFKHNFDRYGAMQMNYINTVNGILPTLKPQVQRLFETLLSNNYLFDPITSVIDGGVQRVYSLKVDSTCHSFVGNGFINHNTEARLAAITSEMLFDLEKETVNFVPNFDATLKEPTYLPAKLPNLLLMGSEGIAVGMATKIPPHNLTEVVEALVYMIEKQPRTHLAAPVLTSDVTIPELLEFVKGPDFPTAGTIYDIAEIKNLYATGRGKILIRGKAEIEDIGQGKSAIIITELPYQVNKALLVARIADLAKEKRVEGVTDLRDESDRHGIRIVVELKRDAPPRKVLNNLFKHTSLQTIFPANIVALVDGTPQTLNLKTILLEYLKHRFSVVTRRSEFELKEAKARLHILEGLRIAVENIDAVIKTIKESKDQDDAKKNLMAKFRLTDIQATAILDMQLRRLAALERQKIEDEYEMVKETISYLEELLANPAKILTVVKQELLKVKEKYQDARRTRVVRSKVSEFSEEDLVANEPTVITLTATGYIKRQSLLSFRTQQRGGKGVRGMTTKEEDSIAHLRYSQTHDNILFFTNKGKAYQLRAFEIQESSRQSRGTAIVNLLNILQDEKVESFVTYHPKETEGFVFLTTRNGTVKKTNIKKFLNIRRSGIAAIKLDSNDELTWSSITTGEDDILIVTRNGKAIRFSEKSARPLGRATTGVRGIRLRGDDEVIGMAVVKKNDKSELLVATENGVGKKTPVSQFKRQSRGGQGVKAANVTQKTGKVAVAQVIPDSSREVIITSRRGLVVKLEIEGIPRLSRATQGVILMRFSDKNDKVAAAACIS